MKKMLIASLLMCSCINAIASTSKVCFGSTKNDDTKGIIMTAEIIGQLITLKTIKGDFYNGTYPTYNTSVNGRDGKTYLAYAGENSDYQDVILVDKVLLQNNTTGLLQVRARGEGFFNNVFVCKDAQ